MSSRGKNFRRRAGDDDANGEEPSTTVTTKPPSKEPSVKTKKPPKLLSFADDEEDESPSRPSSSSITTREKKSSSSSSSRIGKSSLSSSTHRISSSKDRLSSSSASTTTATTSSVLPSNVQPQAGEYTKERLRELQKNTRSLASSKPARPSEPIIVLKGLIKPISDEDKKGNEESEEEEDGGEGLNGAENQLALMGIGGKSRDSMGDAPIYDQAKINEIRAKRERARMSRAAAPDFISLDGGSNHGAAEGLSDEEPEFQGRITLLGDKRDGVMKGVFESVDVKIGPVLLKQVDVGEFDDEDEEDKIWEEEQCRKGLGKRIDDSANNVSNSVPVASQIVRQQQHYGYQAAEYVHAPSAPVGLTIGGNAGVSRSLEQMSIPQQAEVAFQALRDNVRRLKESHGRTLSTMARTDENLLASLSNTTDLEQALSVAGEKFIFMQKLRDFVSVICDFLKHKGTYIEELEDEMRKLHEERASAIVERRVADSADEMREVEAAVKAAKSVLDKGGNSAAMITAAATAALAASAATREQSILPVKLDEFGRDKNLQERMAVKRRAESHKRRKARYESKRVSSVRDDIAYHRIEGESSTDESDSETASYQSNRELLLQTAEQVLSDASEEYSQLSVVKEKFETWKSLYSSEYRDAYMSLSVPAIFSPYVRLELLGWDPLHKDADFNDMNWHSLLFEYGVPQHGGGFNSDDADADLVPGLVEKVALPILHHAIANCWDILSTRGTINAVSATDMVINYVPASSEALRKLLSAIHTRLADAVTDLVVPTWSTDIIRAVPDAARIAAYRFGTSIRLLKNICLWKDILHFQTLEQLALDELLSGKILPHIRSIAPNIHDAVTRTERIIASLSGVWSGPNATREHSHKVQPLVDCVLSFGKTLEKKHAAGADESETNSLARRLKKMLVDLNEYDKARTIARTFQLKEAL